MLYNNANDNNQYLTCNCMLICYLFLKNLRELKNVSTL